MTDYGADREDVHRLRRVGGEFKIVVAGSVPLCVWKETQQVG